MTQGIVDFNDWQEIELRVGKIIEVFDIEGADKLYKFIVDLGSKIGNRTICAGIKEHYSKKALKGKKISVFVNLKPKKLRGIESQGMILAACTDDESKVILVTPEKDIGVGSRIY